MARDLVVHPSMAYARNSEGKVETMAAVRIHAARGFVPVARIVPAEF